jgi:hypothetical protein
MRKFFGNNSFGRVEIISCLFCGILLIITSIAPWLFTHPAICDRLNFTDTGSIGDTIGGLTSPFVGLIGAILVFISFMQQVKANKSLKESEDTKYYFELCKKIDENLDSVKFNFTIPKKKIDTRNLIKYILAVRTKKKIETRKIEIYQNITYSIKNFAFCISAYLILTKNWKSQKQFIKVLEIKLRHYRNNLKLKKLESLLKEQLKLHAIFFVRHLNPDEKAEMLDIFTNREKLDKYIEKAKKNNNDVNLLPIEKIRNNFVYSFVNDLDLFDKIS